jgi:hypothetical protein
MKKIIFSLIISWTNLLTACMAAEVAQMPPRTPMDLLLDVKTVADSDDLSKIDFVGSQLKIDLVQGTWKPVFNNDGNTILGYGREIKQNGMAKEYLPDNFRYGVFQPNGRKFQRIIASISINSAVICIKPSDLSEIFINIEKHPNPEISSLEYSYENPKNRDIIAYFRFEKSECLFKFGFSQNRNKE